MLVVIGKVGDVVSLNVSQGRHCMGSATSCSITRVFDFDCLIYEGKVSYSSTKMSKITNCSLMHGEHSFAQRRQKVLQYSEATLNAGEFRVSRD
jgi:hypothetical protein